MTSSRLFDRAIVRLSPLTESEDAAEFLQSLITNDVTRELPLYAALLSPQGKTMYDFIVWRDGRDLLLDCEDTSAEALIKRLSLYRLRRKIAIARDDSVGVHWCKTPVGTYASDPRLAELGTRWLAPTIEHDTAADQDWLAHRLSLGVCEGRAELSDILWLETNAAELNGVAFDKGCYIGQENTARMNWRNKVNRRLMVVPIEQSDPKRRIANYPQFGRAVDHLRVAETDHESLPDWLIAAVDQKART